MSFQILDLMTDRPRWLRLFSFIQRMSFYLIFQKFYVAEINLNLSLFQNVTIHMIFDSLKLGWNELDMKF